MKQTRKTILLILLLSPLASFCMKKETSKDVTIHIDEPATAQNTANEQTELFNKGGWGYLCCLTGMLSGMCWLLPTTGLSTYQSGQLSGVEAIDYALAHQNLNTSKEACKTFYRLEKSKNPFWRWFAK